ncbi:MAG: thioredoxin [Acidobacteria bacterium]|nr:thioredoxin [Acidobacteriota bacterium]
MSTPKVEGSFEHDILHSPVPVLLDFWAPWCMPCRMQVPILAEISRGEAGRARIIKVNVDEQPELAAQFGVSSIPTLLVISNGQVRDRFVGVQAAATLRAALHAAAAD